MVRGKSKLCDYLYVYETLFFVLEHPEIRVKVLYFTLEMSPKEKYNEFLCHLLFRLDKIRISPTELKSTDKDHPVDEKILELLETERYLKYIRAYEDMVEYIDDIRNPTGINKYCRDYALSRGHMNYKKKVIRDKQTGDLKEVETIDRMNPYTPEDPELHLIALVDNASNIDSENGLSKMETINKMSKYAITLKNQLGYIFVMIQHQTQAQEGIENFKLNRLKPSSDGLADCKTTTRDANMVIGLYSPFKYGLKEYEGYDITKFRNHIRFMEIIEDRDYGASNQICPLLFDGATSIFTELPKPEDKENMNRVYNYLNSAYKSNVNKIFFTFSSGIHRIINHIKKVV